MQTLQNLIPQVVLALGYISGIATCLTGLVACFGKSDTKVGHAVASFGIDVAKLYNLAKTATDK